MIKANCLLKVFLSEVFSTIKAGTLCIDCSTVDYGFTKSLSERIEAKTAHYVDAPASGGVLAAKRASLTFMIGGDHLSYHRAKALLVLLGRHIVHCGPVNLVLGCTAFSFRDYSDQALNECFVFDKRF